MGVQMSVYVGPHILFVRRCQVFIRRKTDGHSPASRVRVRPVGAAVAVALRWRLRSRGGGGRRRRHVDGDDGDGGGGQVSAMISLSIWERERVEIGHQQYQSGEGKIFDRNRIRKG